jgi:hypothetical protein
VAIQVTRLCEREDFPALLEAAANRLGMNPAIVEKDYYVTEALRIIAERFGHLVLFKGGTSLSKGWKLIERFSEDIDLYVQPDHSSSRATDRRLKEIVSAVARHPALIREEERKRSVSLGRTEYFLYSLKTGGLPSLDSAVMLEAGVQSGDYPVEERSLQSLLGELLDREGVASGAADQASFRMRLLHFRRTFVEKLFTLHDRVERLVRQQDAPLGSYARHYYDLHRLLLTEEVRRMLPTPEYGDIAADYRRLTREHYPKQALPERMELRDSPALFPPAELRTRLQSSFDQCRRLCYGAFPSFDEVLAGLEEIREHLIAIPEPGR